MVCPACPASSALGGFIGAWFGVNAPKTTKGKILSIALTGTATALTVIALRVLGNISLCNGNYTWSRITSIIAGATLVGTIYSIGINHLIHRFIEATPKPVVRRSCCGMEP
jgi:hypothetical protein